MHIFSILHLTLKFENVFLHYIAQLLHVKSFDIRPIRAKRFFVGNLLFNHNTSVTKGRHSSCQLTECRARTRSFIRCKYGLILSLNTKRNVRL